MNPIAFGCYYSVFEFMKIFSDYLVTVTDYNKLFYNLVHNLGNIYDNTVDLSNLFTTLDIENPNWWAKVGKLVGDTINQVAYKPKNYEPYFP